MRLSAWSQMVSDNYKSPNSGRSRVRQRYAGWRLSNVKTTHDVSASAASQPVYVLLVLLYNAHILPGVQNYKNKDIPAISLTKLRH